MKDEEIESKVETAFSRQVPDVLDNILQRCNVEESKVMVKENKYEGFWFKCRLLVGATIGVLVIFCGVVGINFYNSNYKIDSIIGFDVNPSIELNVNKKEEVIEVKALNEEAKRIIADMDLEDVDIDVAVNALIGSMLKNGYLTVDSNSILVSVQNDDEEKRVRLQEEITREITSLLSVSKIEGALLSQEVVKDDDTEGLSQDYGISLGKAKLIKEIIAANVKDSKGVVYTFDSLAGLSINELNVLLSEKHASVDSVTVSGTASKGTYIGETKALNIALEDAGVKESNARELEVEFDADDGRLVYEVEFQVSGHEYEYDINATTGQIIYRHTEKDDDYIASDSEQIIGTNTTKTTKKAATKTTTKSGSNYIGEAKAKSIALKNAGVTESEIREYEIELDKERGTVAYEIEFKVGRTEYSYDINALNGKIIKKDIDIDD